MTDSQQKLQFALTKSQKIPHNSPGRMNYRVSIEKYFEQKLTVL